MSKIYKSATLHSLLLLFFTVTTPLSAGAKNDFDFENDFEFAFGSGFFLECENGMLLFNFNRLLLKPDVLYECVFIYYLTHNSNCECALLAVILI